MLILVKTMNERQASHLSNAELYPWQTQLIKINFHRSFL